MKTSVRLALALPLFLCLVSAQAAEPNTKARLLLSADAARPGDSITAALELRMAPGWHTYWRNGGSSGMPTKIEWQFPPGISAAAIEWPVPEKEVQAGVSSYIYKDRVLLLVPLTIAPNTRTGTVELKANASWLECAQLCLPGSAMVQAKLQIGPDTRPSSDAQSINEWRDKLPASGKNFDVQAHWESPTATNARPVVIEWKGAGPFDFFPNHSDDFEVAGETELLKTQGNAIRKIVTKFEGDWPDQLAGILVQGSKGFEVELRLAKGAAATPATPPPSVPAAKPFTEPSFLTMLFYAFLGGLILNVMPCVLPVLALKILGFVSQSKEQPGRVRKLGLIFGLGVLASFLALAGLVIAVQQAGRAAGWGMQFGNPQFLVAMTLLVTLVSLNLFGVFEVQLGGRAMGAAGTLASKQGNAGAFFNGILATALATPCTAPFLAPALGFAFLKPPLIIILFFLTIGAGLALPYVVLSWYPQWLRILPKPGLWMERFKVAMGFPMLATAIWLFYLASSRFGENGTLWLGLFLVTSSMAAWVWGEFVQRGRSWKAGVVSLLLFVFGYAYALENELHWRTPRAAVARAGAETEIGGVSWKRWSLEAVAAARAAGHPVLVDFTANWCFLCQVNKTTSLDVDSVREKLKQTKAVAMIADYTDFPPDITAELRKFHRAGVPLVVVFPADPKREPIVLPETLLPGIVLRALDEAATATVASGEKMSRAN